MTSDNKMIRDILITYKDGTQELLQNKNANCICVPEEKYNKIRGFYEKYAPLIKELQIDKSINALIEIQSEVNR